MGLSQTGYEVTPSLLTLCIPLLFQIFLEGLKENNFLFTFLKY